MPGDNSLPAVISPVLTCLLHMSPVFIQRKRRWYALFILVTIIIGLGSRKYPSQLPEFIAAYAGDTMWTLHFFLWIGFLFPTVTTTRAAIGALFFSYFIEIVQFYHAPWIDALRATAIGGLLLGYDFLWSDILCYTVGTFIGVAGEMLLLPANRKKVRHIFRKPVGG